MRSGAHDFPLGVSTVTMDAVDGAGNNATQVSFTVTVSDNEAPTINIGNLTGPVAGKFTAVLMPASDGEIKLSVAAGVLSDAAGNGNVMSNEVSAMSDETPPTVALTTTSTSTSRGFNVMWKHLNSHSAQRSSGHPNIRIQSRTKENAGRGLRFNVVQSNAC